MKRVFTLVAALVLVSPFAFSGGFSTPPLRFQEDGVALGHVTTVNCSTGVTCAVADGVLTATAEGGGGSSVSRPFLYACAQQGTMRTGYRAHSAALGVNTNNFFGYGPGQFALNAGGAASGRSNEWDDNTLQTCISPYSYCFTFANGNVCGFHGSLAFDMTHGFAAHFGMKAHEIINDTRYWVGIGMNDATTFGQNTINEADASMFRYVSGTDTTWKGCNRGTSAAQVCCDTGVAIVAQRYYSLTLEKTRVAGAWQVAYTVRDAAGNTGTCTNTTSVPAGNQGHASAYVDSVSGTGQPAIVVQGFAVD